MQNYKLDVTDKDIIRYLQQDAKLTTKELAGRLNLSATPVYERVRRLENDGIIKRYVAVVDREKIGKGLMVLCNIRLKEHSRDQGRKFVNSILTMAEVVECLNISGDYDFLLKVVVSDMAHYQSFIMNKLGGLENIGSTQSIFVMGEIKNFSAYDPE